MHSNWKGRSEIVSICRRHDLYMQKAKESTPKQKGTKKPVRINNKFSKVAGCKIKTKSVKFLYINNEQSGKEIK